MLPSWLITFRAFALASAFAAAFVPIATYITDDKRDWLWIHIGVNIAAYIAVALTTIYTTVNLTQQDHNKFSVPAYWGNNVVMRTWYLGLSKMWRWHVAAAVGRLGLALALAQHVHIVMINGWPEYRVTQFQGILNQFMYYSYNTDVASKPIVWSQWETTLIGLVLLCVFAVLETGFLTAFTLIIYTAKMKFFSSRFVTPLFRVAIVLLVIGLLSFAQNTIRHADKERWSDLPDQYQLVNHWVSYRSVYKEWAKLGFTWVDNGTMLATWIMRPITDDQFNYSCYKREWQSNKPTVCDNRTYIVTDLLTALGSYVTYILAIIASLQLAQYVHWRREQSLITAPSSTN